MGAAMFCLVELDISEPIYRREILNLFEAFARWQGTETGPDKSHRGQLAHEVGGGYAPSSSLKLEKDRRVRNSLRWLKRLESKSKSRRQ